MVTIDTISQERQASGKGANGALDNGCRLRAIARDVYRRFAVLAECRRSRRALFAMTDEQLRDIGVSRDAARHEARRPFWDSTEHRAFGR